MTSDDDFEMSAGPSTPSASPYFESKWVERSIDVNNHCFMGKLLSSELSSPFSVVDGRFLLSLSWSDNVFRITDLFYSREKKLTFVFTTATIDGQRLESDGGHFVVYDFYALDLRTMIVCFTNRNSLSQYVGVATVDFERSCAVIEQTFSLGIVSVYHTKWFPKSRPANTSDGLILMCHCGYGIGYFEIKLGTENQLVKTKLDLPLNMTIFGYFDGCLYGLLRIRVPPSIAMVKYSFETRKQIRENTVNWEMLRDNDYEFSLSEGMCCVGTKLFVCNFSAAQMKSRDVCLDLQTLEWQRTADVFDDRIFRMSSDEQRTFIVSTLENDSKMYRIYRFVNNPDKLSDCAWLQLKRIVDTIPGSYEFIISQLPTNFKPRSLF
ncbi:hypothetical protein M3Y98_00701800 [Aphelenchoides besseyi]|nr:hypothetical protein M3Y98_00701800 [Aphelenchoides besseyi]KAI6210421.1 hypothetical protein M3Y96_00326300 [Aphelenchoides besseyi]